MTARPGRDRDGRLRAAFGWTILAAWVTSFVLSALDPRYTPPLGVEGLALIVAGGLFAEPAVRTLQERRHDRDRDRDEGD